LLNYSYRVPEREPDDGNVSDGDVFQGETMDRPDFIDADLKMRRATVTGASPPAMKRSSLSDLTDLHSDASFAPHVRPKSYFPGFIHDTVTPLQKSTEHEFTKKTFDVRMTAARKGSNTFTVIGILPTLLVTNSATGGPVYRHLPTL